MENLKENKTADYKWYALKIASNKEKTMKDHFLKHLELNNIHNVVRNVLIPTMREVVVHGESKKIKETLMLPGYLLVEADMSIGGELLKLIKTAGIPDVFGFISHEKKSNSLPSAIAKSEMERYLHNTSKEDLQEDLSIYKFNVADSVKIIEGPFTTFSGFITKVDYTKKLMQVSVKVFGRDTPVDLPFNGVEKTTTKNINN